MIDLSWVGGMPTNWKAVPLKSKFTFGKGLSITKADLVDEGVPVLSYGQIHSKANLRVRIDDSLLRFVPQIIANEGKDSLAVKNGFIFADTSEDLDGCGNCNYVDRDDVYGGYHTVVLKPKASTDTDHRYLAYLFQTDAWRFQIRKELTEVKVFSISQKVLKSTWILVPPLPDQRAIVAYLDKKCTAIDEAIDRHRKIIEKLEEYQNNCLIYAMTKGIDHATPLKDSAVPWIGSIPSQWNICRIKFVISFSGSGTTPKSDDASFYDGNIPWIQSGDLYGNAEITRTAKQITDKALVDCTALKVYPAPFVVVAMYGASVGNVSISKIDACVNQACCVLMPSDGICLDWLKYWLMVCKSDFIGQAVGGGQPNISQSKINEEVCLQVPYDEQISIVKYLDKIYAQTNETITKHSEIIAKLEEYRKSIIYNAVTGKIDCREVVK